MDFVEDFIRLLAVTVRGRVGLDSVVLLLEDRDLVVEVRAVAVEGFLVAARATVPKE